MHRTAILLTALTGGLALAGAANAAAARPCAALLKAAVPGQQVTITKAEAIPAKPGAKVTLNPAIPPLTVDMPAYCRVEGVIEPRTGVGGKPFGLKFALALPDAWNGRFLFQGGGGLNGSVGAPLGQVAAGDKPALLRGFAVVATDSGHQGGVFDDAFMADQEAALNFALFSVGKVTTAAKALVAAHYGRGPERSYFAGCSTGGREAMEATERFPGYFDGVVAGAPAQRTSHSNMALAWAGTQFNRVAPKDASGKPLPGQAFSKADRQLLMDRLAADCDGLDGLKDGIIFDGAACKFDPGELTCAGAKTDACLSPAQVEALRLAYAGPRTKGGVQVYPGWRWDLGNNFQGAGLPGFLVNAGKAPVGPPNTATEMDVDAAYAKVAADSGQSLIDTHVWTNLSSFFGHGGKVLYFHGVSDPWFSANDSVEYYGSLAAANGGEAKVRQAARLFLVPGMSHCGGGVNAVDRFDLLGAVVDWVEQGKAPASVPAYGPAGISRPLCPYPAHAQYNGAGDAKDAASFSCKE